MEQISKLNLDALRLLVESWTEIAEEKIGKKPVKKSGGKSKDPTPQEIKQLQALLGQVK